MRLLSVLTAPQPVEHSSPDAVIKMEDVKKIDVDYSMKNIPMPSKAAYKKTLIEKVESFIKRMRWRAFHFLKGNDKCEDTKETYGFKTRKCPPQIPELKAFESDVLKLIEDVEFRTVSDDFQEKLKKDVERFRNTDDLIVKADKTKSMYRVSGEKYQKLMRDNITKHYRAAPDSLRDEINADAKAIAESLALDDRMEVIAETDAFITLKDHKERFANDLPCRLINPAKPDMGRVSKAILDDIVSAVKKNTNVNLWKNTSAVIDWFSAIDEKNSHTFISFDVVEFYPSITEPLLKQAISFAKQFIHISQEDEDIIMHARRSLLFGDGKTWVKRDKDTCFDVTMGSFDGAEVCELVGAFILNELSTLIPKHSIGLYRDDGLAVLKNTSGPQIERTKKEISRIMKSFNLKITIDANLKVTNFLDVTFSLETGKHSPYRKPNDQPLYVHASSNHPPSILRNIPAAIARRVSEISSDKAVFDEATPAYKSALEKSGYPSNMVYTEKGDQKKRKPRKRNITWFNPPYSKNVSTNIAAKFLSLVRKHFPKGSPLNKIFNRNTVKVSYSCMPNMGSIISGINKRKMTQQELTKPCNCRVKKDCPLNGDCQTANVVYQADITDDGETCRTYVGLSEPPFKLRYRNHQSSMRNRSQSNSTELSKHSWLIKDQGKVPTITWKVTDIARGYSNTTKKCHLCTTEKYRIITADKQKSLNKRTELVSTCRHSRKFLLSNFTPIT